MKLYFRLPKTKLCVVVWYRNNQKNEVLIPTPGNNTRLAEIMLQHKVGASEIRAVKPVEASGLIQQLN